MITVVSASGAAGSVSGCECGLDGSDLRILGLGLSWHSQGVHLLGGEDEQLRTVYCLSLLTVSHYLLLSGALCIST